MPIKTFKLYGVEGVDYDAVIAKYRELCSAGIIDVDWEDYFDATSKRTETVIKAPRAGLKDATKVKNKALYIVHTIAYRSYTQKETSDFGVSVMASVLRQVIGIDYQELLRALIDLGYVETSSWYAMGKSSKQFRVVGSITMEQCSNTTIRKYIEHTKKILNDKITQRLQSKQFIDEYGEDFAPTYIRNLNKFYISDVQGFDRYASDEVKREPNKKGYYEFVKAAFDNNLKIYKVDDNNRIYHILTSLERELKEYVNIRYSIDCSNSHPVLFNYFIQRSKGLDISTSYSLSSILYNLPPDTTNSNGTLILHYDLQKLHNTLKSKKIQKSKIAGLSDDELLYMWRTMRGTFWDEILVAHVSDALDRAEIKQKMFAEVFYSKTRKMAWKTFAKEFKQTYPNVYRLIARWKEPLKYKDTQEILLRRKKAVQLDGKVLMMNPETALPNLMMEMESTIFREILQSLYRKRIAAIHIHDAIVIPAVKSTENLDADTIVSIMRDAYKKFGLHPSFKVDTH